MKLRWRRTPHMPTGAGLACWQGQLFPGCTQSIGAGSKQADGSAVGRAACQQGGGSTKGSAACKQAGGMQRAAHRGGGSAEGAAHGESKLAGGSAEANQFVLGAPSCTNRVLERPDAGARWGARTWCTHNTSVRHAQCIHIRHAKHVHAARKWCLYTTHNASVQHTQRVCAARAVRPHGTR